MVGRFEDPDEKVRVAICKVIGSLDYETALHHVRAKTLQVAGGRMLDKKVSKPYKEKAHTNVCSASSADRSGWCLGKAVRTCLFRNVCENQDNGKRDVSLTIRQVRPIIPRLLTSSPGFLKQ